MLTINILFFSEFKKPNHDDQFMGGTGKKILYQSSITGWKIMVKFVEFDLTFRMINLNFVILVLVWLQVSVGPWRIRRSETVTCAVRPHMETRYCVIQQVSNLNILKY